MSITHWMDTHACQRLMLTLGHFAWQASGIGLAAGGAGWALRRSCPTRRYAVYLAALLGMLLCPLVTFPLVDVSPSAPAAVVTDAAQPTRPDAGAALPPAEAKVAASKHSFAAESGRHDASSSPAPAAAPPVSAPATGSDLWRRWAPHATAVYLLGVCMMLARLLLGLHGGRRLRKASCPVADTELLAALARQAGRIGLRFTPAVAYCERVVTPAVVGLLRPMVLLPVSLAAGMAAEHVEAILAHELAHIRRRDHLVNLLQRVAEAVFFFHPAVWFISRRLRAERELCCDDVAVAAGGPALGYAESLVELADRSLSVRSPARLAGAAILGAAARPSRLAARVRRLLGEPSESARLPRIWPVAAAVMAMIVAASSMFVNVRGAPRPASTAEPKALRKDLSLEIRVIGVDGKAPEKSSILFWRAVGERELTKPAVPSLPRLFGNDQVWRDTAGKIVWQQCGNFGAGDRATATDLPPGRYRVAVSPGHGAPTMLGVSDVIRLDGTRKHTTVTVRIEPGPSLTIRAVDAATGKPVDRATMRLDRSDGLSVTRGPISMADGEHTFRHLAPSEYTLRVGKRARLFKESDYVADADPIRIKLLAGKDQRVAVPLRAVQPDQAEVRRRWPWIVTGTVTDAEGKPMAGVTIAAHCGMGTLWQTGKVTTGDDGTYRLRFGPGMHGLAGGRWVAGLQAATIRAGKPGWVEKNDSRHGGLKMAEKPPPPDNVWGAKPKDVLLPNKPRRLDFIMLPATTAPAGQSRAWQRTDKYVPPDFDGFFPDDPAAGKQLDELFPTLRTDSRPDEQILRIVRNGLRRTTRNRSYVLRSVGNRYIWGKDPQHGDAVEIMYHAAQPDDRYGTRHYAVYFGLSVLKRKTPNVLRALIDLCMAGHDVGRITWGSRGQVDELRALLKPHLVSKDPKVREMAGLLDRHFKGEIDFEKWRRDRRIAEAAAKYAGEFPRFRRILTAGSVEEKAALVEKMWRDPYFLSALDDSFVEPLSQCAADADGDVRSRIAVLVGRRWIWGARPQHPKAIALALEVSKDPAAMYNAVYYGLSVVRPKSDEVIARLLEIAMADPNDPNLAGRITWGLRTDAGKAAAALLKHLDAYRTDPDAAVSAYLLYTDITGAEPPGARRFANLGVFVVAATPKATPTPPEALLKEFRAHIPKNVRVRSLKTVKTFERPQAVCLVRGLAAQKALVAGLARSKLLVANPKPVLATASMRQKLGLPAAEEEGAVPGGEASTMPAGPDRRDYERAFVDLYLTLGRQYPCFKLKAIDWRAVGAELLPRARDVKTHEQFGLLCMALIARLEDSHAYLRPGTAKPPTPSLPRWDPGLACLIDDRGKPVVYHVDRGGPADKAGVKIGSTVVSVNAAPAERAIGDFMKRQSRYYGYSSDRYLRYHAARFFLRQMKPGQKVRLVLTDPAGRTRRLELPATLGVRYLPRLPVPIKGIRDSGSVSWTMLDGNVGYIYVRRIKSDLIGRLDKAVGELKAARGLIVDVRGNSGGGFDGRRAFRNFDLADKTEPDRPRFAGPMALLIDARCISAGEGWASWFIARKRAKLFGQATAGASARKTTYTLTNGLYQVTFPVKAYRGFLRRPIERRGLEPDVPLMPNARDLAAGKDTVLEAARRFLVRQGTGGNGDDRSH